MQEIKCYQFTERCIKMVYNNISQRVIIKPQAKIFVGCYGTATKVTDELSFYVELDPHDGIEGGLWFSDEELEFLK